MAVLLLFLIVSPAFAQQAPVREGWKLIWSDEFEQPGAPDPTNWSYEVGFVRNHEAQYYTENRRENARVEDGKLVIEGRKETFANARHDPRSDDWARSRKLADYTSACVVTQDKRAFHFGRIDVRAKLPRGQGVWPAIWMMGENRTTVGWPTCGEIDIMELVWAHPRRIHGTIHFANPDPKAEKKHTSRGGFIDTQASPSDDFHLYSIEWSREKIDLFYDDTLYKTVRIDDLGADKTNPFHQPMYLLLNFAIGGSWGGQVDPAIFPQRFEIDFVRYYQKQ